MHSSNSSNETLKGYIRALKDVQAMLDKHPVYLVKIWVSDSIKQHTEIVERK